MKKLIFLTVGMIFSLHAFTQRAVLTKSISLDLPNGAEKINKEQVVAHTHKKFNPNKETEKLYTDFSTKQSFKIGDILILLFPFDTVEVKPEKGDVSNFKKGVDELNRGNSTYSSYIKKNNGNSVVVTNYTIGSIEQYHFYCYNSDYSKALNGRLEFVKTDKDKATAILNQILNSIKFKD